MKRQWSVKTIIIVVVFALLAVLVTAHLVINLYPELTSLMSIHADEKIAAYIEKEGAWKGMVCLVILCIIQVAGVFLPGGPVQIAAGLVYVWWKAFLVCYGGFMLGNVIVYAFARMHGPGRLMSHGRVKDIMERFKEHAPVHSVALANLVPGIPNGACPYVAAALGVPLKDFVLAVGSTCWIQILGNCVAGHLLIRGAFVPTAITCLTEWALTFVIYELFRKSGR